jgi:arginyl-tRNA synthetase
MLIAELDDKFPDFIENMPNLGDLLVFYQEAKSRFDKEPEFKARAHSNVVKLQAGDDHCIKGWKILCDISREDF